MFNKILWQYPKLAMNLRKFCGGLPRQYHINTLQICIHWKVLKNQECQKLSKLKHNKISANDTIFFGMVFCLVSTFQKCTPKRQSKPCQASKMERFQKFYKTHYFKCLAVFVYASTLPFTECMPKGDISNFLFSVY